MIPNIQDLNPPERQLSEMVVPYLDELLIVFGERRGYLLIITDEKGVVEGVYGDREAMHRAGELNLKEGMDLTDGTRGFNAVEKALKEERPVQIGGEEHNNKTFQMLTCSAAPIFDDKETLWGTLCLITDKEEAHPHTLGLVSTTAKAIENKFHNTTIQQQLYEAQQYAFGIMNELSFGLIATNTEGVIRWVNDTACRSLNIRRLNLINENIQSIYSHWDQLQEEIDQEGKLLDHEMDFGFREKPEKYLMNAYSIRNEIQENIGYVITFRPLSRMLSLMSKYSSSQLNFTFDKIVYRSTVMKKLIEYAKAIANAPSTILITGESGTGKEVFAQAIHNASERRNSGFFAINCGAISPSLMESELFGYEEGAFTGAQKGGKPGKIESAHKGTLFLDEIGEMPLDMQVKLLRTLQEKTITRVGGNKEIKVDVRVIVATNKDLAAEVEKGHFREDLYYRLSVIPLHLPPLRERPADIQPLFRYLLATKADKLNRPVPSIDKNTEEYLLNYHWPGNVRELENLAEKTAILGDRTREFLGQDAPEEQEEKERKPRTEDFLQRSNSQELPDLAEIEEQVIRRYLDIFDRNVSKTARALGIGRNTLYQKMKRFGIE